MDTSIEGVVSFLEDNDNLIKQLNGNRRERDSGNHRIGRPCGSCS